MAVRSICKLGDDILRKKSESVVNFEETLWQMLDDMKETMYAFNGVGLAGVQIGVLKRVIMVDISHERNTALEFINPVVLHVFGQQESEEGCLSCDNMFGIVKRPQKILVEYRNRFNKKETLTAENFFAAVISHEMDHLNGVLFIDKMIKNNDNLG